MIQLLILGLIKAFPNIHGYEIMKRMDDQHYKYLIFYTKGSLYYNLHQMESKGYLTVTLSDDIKHYKITDAGNELFQELMIKFGNESEYVNLKFYGPMLFQDMIPDVEFDALLESQIQQTRVRINNIKQTLDSDHSDLDKRFILMLENSLAHHQVNLNWFLKLQEMDSRE